MLNWDLIAASGIACVFSNARDRRRRRGNKVLAHIPPPSALCESFCLFFAFKSRKKPYR